MQPREENPKSTPPASILGTVPLSSRLWFVLWDSWCPLCIAAGKTTRGDTVLERAGLGWNTFPCGRKSDASKAVPMLRPQRWLEQLQTLFPISCPRKRQNTKFLRAGNAPAPTSGSQISKWNTSTLPQAWRGREMAGVGLNHCFEITFLESQLKPTSSHRKRELS